ncbi:hypothetical protein [Arthrobacter sp. ok362]|uniref:hypothetical protein n=1 Tax=Arthrobacter sp. ok362 TaxID=1761745 RepID=UPI0008883D32|nr:hypothetical protein [Arthrobacter sp. ok362]SDL40522.1 hypothetical protein SAMN04487913_10975 [Arthrobacter sp. ok362]
MSTGEPNVGNAPPAGAQDVPEELLEVSKSLAKALDEDSGRRNAIPIRKSFVRAAKGAADSPPLAELVRRGGRGGGVIVKLYLALVWRCSGGAFDTDISARTWARLLALEDPNFKGARRVSKAIKILEDCKLISVLPRRGEPSVITLRDESGDDSPYTLPSTAYSSERLPRDIYFKVPATLWTEGFIQRMSAPAVTMLLILLAEQSGDANAGDTDGKDVWWSTERFPQQYSVSPSMRSRGTKDLREMHLLYVERASVAPPGNKRTFARERVRNVYRLQNQALVYGEEKPTSKKGATKKGATKKKPPTLQQTLAAWVEAQKEAQSSS